MPRFSQLRIGGLVPKATWVWCTTLPDTPRSYVTREFAPNWMRGYRSPTQGPRDHKHGDLETNLLTLRSIIQRKDTGRLILSAWSRRTQALPKIDLQGNPS